MRAGALSVRYEEDATLAHAAGANAFRFSVSWSRVEPRRGWFDDAALKRYGRFVDHLVSIGVDYKCERRGAETHLANDLHAILIHRFEQTREAPQLVRTPEKEEYSAFCRKSFSRACGWCG